MKPSWVLSEEDKSKLAAAAAAGKKTPAAGANNFDTTFIKKVRGWLDR